MKSDSGQPEGPDDDRRANTARDPGTDRPDTESVITPGGIRDRSLVHHVSKESVVRPVGDKRVQILHQGLRTVIVETLATGRPSLAQPLAGGYVAYAHWTNDTEDPISEFRATWRVPPQPATQGKQTIFLFNGIQNSDGADAILQPVLRWEDATGTEGSRWSVASWYVAADGQVFHSDFVPVNPGDDVVGVITFVGRTPDGRWSYTSEFENVPGTRLSIEDIAEPRLCLLSLEAYRVDTCSKYPDTDATHFVALTILGATNPLPVIWAAYTEQTTCGVSAKVVSNSSAQREVHIRYRGTAGE